MKKSRTSGYVDMPAYYVVRIGLLGVIVGVFGFGVSLFLDKMLGTSSICSDTTISHCILGSNLLNYVGILAAIAGLVGLVKLDAYRPLIIVIAACAALWGLGSMTQGMDWNAALSWWALLYAGSYVLFGWLVRPRSLPVTLILVILSIIAVRIGFGL